MEDTTRGLKVPSGERAGRALRSRRARRRHTCLDNLTQVVNRFLTAGELPVFIEDGSVADFGITQLHVATEVVDEHDAQPQFQWGLERK